MRSSTRRMAAFVAVTASALALVSVASPADATYRGQNGRIAFASNVGGGTYQLFTMDASGLHVRKLTHLPDRGWVSFVPDWSPDGRRILFTFPNHANACCLQIYRIDADGTSLTQVTHTSNADNIAARWSPDGRHIVFARSSFTGNNVIWVMNADGTHAHALTSPLYDSFRPEFTPDGRRIVFESEKSGLLSAIWIMHADGSGKRRLTPASLQGGAPDVSPDGTHIAFISNENSEKPTAIFTMRIDGTEIRRLTDPGCCHHDADPAYSPDGTRIVFKTDRNYPSLNGTDIYTMRTDGTGLRELTTNTTIGGCPDDFNCVNPDWGAAP